MRRTLLCLALLAGCGDSGTTDSGTNADMATGGAKEDMTTPPSDQAGLDLTPQSSGDMATQAQNVMVTVGGNNTLTFAPDPVTVHVGDTVTWTFASSGHNVVSITNNAPDGKFCSPSDQNCNAAPTAGSGTTYAHTFTSVGQFPYACIPHLGAGMKGTVRVTMSQ